ncbi:DUF4174 domain-containing protein [Jannaschia aquimarina]|uniref:DUF4174 domain-containing protein n=2 Tax=Jannaschia aquimarina TaxID=935700 RepID=A0A0D1CMR5_9RHOB|nr:DUF4174 domain-containing protein [Jannaschia aquimarina]KIT16087.1 hypothetical protein jaqu_23590 [Jannaschia aquimarina]SNT02052.1 protein of unknown function [Jannaschia aquimarina]
MISRLTLSAFLALAAPAFADTDAVVRWQQEPTTVFDATEIDIDAFQWIARPVVVFANTPADPAFQEQMEEIIAELDRLVERDVVVITDTDPDGQSDLRRQLRPRGFMMVLMGKDGQVSLRKPLPWTVRELSRSIDKMPMRRRELRENPSGDAT